MDFVDLATTSQEWIHRGLTAVATHISNNNNHNNEDDDFVKNMEPMTAPHYDYHSSTSSTTGEYYSFSSTNGSVGAATAPLLSKTAEAELYLLATNFLLCKCLYFLLDGDLYFYVSLVR